MQIHLAVDVPPFEAVFNDTNLTMTGTNALHIGVDPMAPEAVPVNEAPSWEVTHSGNSVSLEQELLKSGEVGTTNSLNRAIVKVFNQMLMTSLKGWAMIDPIGAAIKIAGSGLEIQSARLRIVAENLANAQSTGPAPGADPYARKTVTFESELDQATGVDLVRIKRVGVDRTPFRIEHDPGSPAADSKGFV